MLTPVRRMCLLRLASPAGDSGVPKEQEAGILITPRVSPRAMYHQLAAVEECLSQSEAALASPGQSEVAGLFQLSPRQVTNQRLQRASDSCAPSRKSLMRRFRHIPGAGSILLRSRCSTHS